MFTMFANLDEFETFVNNRCMSVDLNRVIRLWLTQPYTRHILSVRNVETRIQCNILEMMVNTQTEAQFTFEMMRDFVTRSEHQIRDQIEQNLPTHRICEFDFDGTTVTVIVTPS